MNNQRLSHEEVREAVTTYFTQDGFTVENECGIQFGSRRGQKHGIADVVVKDSAGHWVAIVECKQGRIGRTKEGVGQLKSYLSATDTRFGILAFSEKPQEWIYYENLRSYVFMERKKHYVDQHIYESPTEDRKIQSVLKRIQQKLKRVTIALIVAVTIIIAIPIGFYIYQLAQKETDYEVRRIIDGDTIEIQYEGKPTSLQLIGINAPETTAHPDKPPEPYGEEAATFLRELLLDESVYLRFEKNEKDQYDRLIGYVYKASDDMFVNLEVIRAGYGRVDTRHLPFKHEELFRTYQARAKEVQKGLWRNSFQ